MSNINKSTNPLVSISCLTYNHADYIEEALNGFIKQETSFKFEVLIHDDASTDGTEEIIRAYQQKYPQIIKPLYEKTNQWNKGRRGSAVFNFPRARGEYIALCEGDDFWTDPLKLQKQVDFLETNKDFGTHAHNVMITGVEYDKSVNRLYHNSDYTGEITLNKIIDGFRLPTNSITFRSNLISKLFQEEWMLKVRSVDKCMYLTLANHAKVYYDHQIMASYRKHPGGVVGSYDSWSYEKHILIHKNQIFFWRNFKKYFFPKYQTEINKNIASEHNLIALKALQNRRYRTLILSALKTAEYDLKIFTELVNQSMPILSKRFYNSTQSLYLRFRIFGSKIKQRLISLLGIR